MPWKRIGLDAYVALHRAHGGLLIPETPDKMTCAWGLFGAWAATPVPGRRQPELRAAFRPVARTKAGRPAKETDPTPLTYYEWVEEKPLPEGGLTLI